MISGMNSDDRVVKRMMAVHLRHKLPHPMSEGIAM